MTTQGWRQKRAVRWLVPVGVVAVLAVGATVTAGSAGAASPDTSKDDTIHLLPPPQPRIDAEGRHLCGM